MCVTEKSTECRNKRQEDSNKNCNQHNESRNGFLPKNRSRRLKSTRSNTESQFNNNAGKIFKLAARLRAPSRKKQASEQKRMSDSTVYYTPNESMREENMEAKRRVSLRNTDDVIRNFLERGEQKRPSRIKMLRKQISSHFGPSSTPKSPKKPKPPKILTEKALEKAMKKSEKRQKKEDKKKRKFLGLPKDASVSYLKNY